MSDNDLVVDIAKSYPGFDLTVRASIPMAGSTAIVGASGSGKSTLLRLIAGFEKADAGKIALGTDIWAETGTRQHLAPRDRPVGVLFQHGRLFPHLSVARNLRFAAARSPKNSLSPSVDDVVNWLALRPLLKKSPTTLSGGERQRAALARALLTRPRLLLLDEPLSGVDSAARQEILPRLKAITEKINTPIIYVSHDIDEVAMLADRILVLEEGRVRAFGPAPSIIGRFGLDAATGRFEAGALLEGQIVDRDLRFMIAKIAIGDQTIAIPDRDDASIGAHVRLRVRARDVAIALSAPSGISIRNALKASIAQIEVEANSPFAYVTLTFEGGELRSQLTRVAIAELSLRDGQEVFALIKSASFAE